MGLLFLFNVPFIFIMLDQFMLFISTTPKMSVVSITKISYFCNTFVVCGWCVYVGGAALPCFTRTVGPASRWWIGGQTGFGQDNPVSERPGTSALE